MEDFVVTCPLVPDVPHLISGFCSSPRIFGLGFLQTPPRGDALALLLTFDSANIWFRDFHPISYGPCPAHTVFKAESISSIMSSMCSIPTEMRIISGVTP